MDDPLRDIRYHVYRFADHRPSNTDARLLLERIQAERAEAARLRGLLARAAWVAEHLSQMIGRDGWRASGGDDGQGHYEGDYREEQQALEIRQWQETVRV